MSHGRVPGIERIVLIGFMAAGKTTVGRHLARALGWRFVDFDQVIAEREGEPPGALIRSRGEAALRRLEEELTEELSGATSVVLAPGGGWGVRPELARRLGPRTVRVWLRVSAAEAVRRAEADGADRPLLGPPEDRLGRAAALLAEREAAYAAAEIVVDVQDREPDAVVGEILRRLDHRAGA